jgi:hypothetical protein
MKHWRRVRNEAQPVLALFGFTILLGVIRWLFPQRGLDGTGPRAIWNAIFAMGVVGVLFVLGGGLGFKVLRWLKLKQLTPTE